MSTYEPIASQTLGSAASSVTFSSIPQGYTDLVLVSSVVGTSATGSSFSVILNSDTGGNYSATALIGNGSSAFSERTTGTAVLQIGAQQSGSSEGVQNLITHFMNYSNSTTYKTVLGRWAAADTGTTASVGLWRNTNPINSVLIQLNGSKTFSSGTTFSLYGIQVGDKAQKAQGGNIVVSSGGYMYHAFTSSGSFIPNEAISADMLIIAGGGGGGAGHGGGGGAGGYRSLTSQSLTAKSYTVIVGAGGSGAAFGGNAKGVSGSNSVFGSNSSTGGGGGGSRWDANGISGGSGGGAGYYGAAGSGNAGSYSPVEGYAGGGGGGANSAGSGGGGATAAGETDNNGEVGGVGGAGSNAHSTWASATNTGVSGYYAGGGGGGANGDYNNGAGGAGGGGGGGYLIAGVSATPNTGSGGGGGPATAGIGQQTGGNGSGGIVIIRYAV